MPLFVPFAIFLLNGTFLHSEVYDKPLSYEVCMHDVSEALVQANKKVPEGGKVVGGCLPLPKDTKIAPRPPSKLTGPDGSQTI